MQMCQRGQLLSAQLQNFTKFWCCCMDIMHFNLIHKLKCETTLILLST